MMMTAMNFPLNNFRRTPIRAARMGIAAGVAVVASAAVAINMPPKFPPLVRGFGDISWKATVHVTEGGKTKAKVVGYSKSVTIARETENACRLTKPRTSKCGSSELVMIPSSGNDEGIFWVPITGNIRQIV